MWFGRAPHRDVQIHSVNQRIAVVKARTIYMYEPYTNHIHDDLKNFGT